MKTWHYALIVFLGGCCYGVLSTFVKLAYSAGFTVKEVTGSQFILGTLLIWSVALFSKKKKLTLECRERRHEHLEARKCLGDVGAGKATRRNPANTNRQL